MEPSEGQHRGIEIRARLVQSPADQSLLMQADSDALHFIAEYGTPDTWAEMLPPILGADGKPWLVLEYRPVVLPDEYPDPED